MDVQVLAKAKILGCPIDAGFVKTADQSCMVVYGKPDPALPVEAFTIGQLLHKVSTMVADISGKDGFETKLKDNLPKNMLDIIYGRYTYDDDAKKKLNDYLDGEKTKMIGTRRTEITTALTTLTDPKSEYDFIEAVNTKLGAGKGLSADEKIIILAHAKTNSTVTIQLNEVYLVLKKANASTEQSKSSEFAFWLQVNMGKLTEEWPIEIDTISIKVYNTKNPTILDEMKISEANKLLNYGTKTQSSENSK
jgi:hypothetical protein